MGELDDKLGAILGDSAAMSQIMALARSLSGEQREEDHCSEPPCAQQAFPVQDDRLRLLEALAPCLRPERRRRLERAAEILRLLRLMREMEPKE